MMKTKVGLVGQLKRRKYRLKNHRISKVEQLKRRGIARGTTRP
jgi:hypothetical protein